ncbi:MAG TPA: ethanolamine ammonia-lyase subunit EutC [Burkholderiales bacterium]|nr:ethanolamine ammonia-lyase subunit EutC [Burkholderiales bacterium]
MNDPWSGLKRFTPARIALGRAGGSLPTSALLAFQLAHAQARDAVQRDLDVASLAGQVAPLGLEILQLDTVASDRRTFIQYPDRGRMLSDASKAVLESRSSDRRGHDAAFILADGLSAAAIERHARSLLETMLTQLGPTGWRIAPLCIVRQARVAIGDEIGALLGAAMSVVLIGERPGLSSPDSLGAYLTWNPRAGRTNAERNCISNIRPEGLDYATAAHKLAYLMRESRRRKLSGVDLKETAPALAPAPLSSVLPEN